MFECLEECGASTECSSLCYRENIVCVDACPCHTGLYFTSSVFLASNKTFGLPEVASCAVPLVLGGATVVIIDYSNAFSMEVDLYEQTTYKLSL